MLVLKVLYIKSDLCEGSYDVSVSNPVKHWLEKGTKGLFVDNGEGEDYDEGVEIEYKMFTFSTDADRRQMIELFKWRFGDRWRPTDMIYHWATEMTAEEYQQSRKFILFVIPAGKEVRAMLVRQSFISSEWSMQKGLDILRQRGDEVRYLPGCSLVYAVKTNGYDGYSIVGRLLQLARYGVTYWEEYGAPDDIFILPTTGSDVGSNLAQVQALIIDDKDKYQEVTEQYIFVD